MEHKFCETSKVQFKSMNCISQAVAKSKHRSLVELDKKVREDHDWDFANHFTVNHTTIN